MERYSPHHWDILVLLFLYYRGFSYFSEITRILTQHYQRTARVMKRLERLGLIETSLEDFYAPNGKYMGRIRAMRLTPKGVEYVEKEILPKYEEYKRYIEILLNGKTSQTP